MGPEIFKRQIERLKQTYGEKNYGDERVKLFWAAFSKYPDETFCETVSECISNNRSAPMLKELLEAQANILERNKLTQDQFSSEKLPPSCGKCIDGRYYLEDANGQTFPHRCTCPRGACFEIFPVYKKELEGFYKRKHE